MTRQGCTACARRTGSVNHVLGAVRARNRRCQTVCLGANLARLEMRILFEVMAKRIDGIELTGEVRKLRSSFIHGIKTLPVTLTPQ